MWWRNGAGGGGHFRAHHARLPRRVLEEGAHAPRARLLREGEPIYRRPRDGIGGGTTEGRELEGGDAPPGRAAEGAQEEGADQPVPRAENRTAREPARQRCGRGAARPREAGAGPPAAPRGYPDQPPP